MNKPLTFCTLALALAAAAVCAQQPPELELQARTNLIVNDNGWNVPPGTSFSMITARINDVGKVVFPAGLVPTPDGVAAGIWAGGHGMGEFVALHHDATIISDPSLNSAGNFAYYTSNDGSSYRLYHHDAATGQSTVVSLLPLTPSSLGNVGLVDDGSIGFKGRLGTGYGIARWASGSGAQLLAVDSNVEPGSWAYIYSPAIAADGSMVVKVSTTDYSHNEIRSFVSMQQDELIVADRATDPASPFSRFDNSLAVNAHGAVAAAVTLFEGNVRALYRFTPTDSGIQATEIARVEIQGTIRAIDSFAPDINDAGQVVFRGQDADGPAIYVGDGEQMARIAGKGDIVETDLGTGRIGQHIDDPSSWPVFSGAPSINNHGDVVFVAGLHPEDDNQIEWGTGVIVAYAAQDDDRIFADGFELAD